jgi:hypothetical protein
MKDMDQLQLNPEVWKLRRFQVVWGKVYDIKVYPSLTKQATFAFWAHCKTLFNMQDILI